MRPRRARVLLLLLALLALVACVAPSPASARPAVLMPGWSPWPVPAAPAGCADASLPVGSLSAARARTALRCLLDHERAKVGAGSLTPLRRLTRAAKAHTAAMVDGAWFDHESPARETFHDRLRRQGLAPRYAGETLAWGCGERTTPQHAMEGWLASRPHRRVVLSARYTHSGVGFRRVAAPQAECAPGVTWTLLLARP